MDSVNISQSKGLVDLGTTIVEPGATSFLENLQIPRQGHLFAQKSKSSYLGHPEVSD